MNTAIGYIMGFLTAAGLVAAFIFGAATNMEAPQKGDAIEDDGVTGMTVDAFAEVFPINEK